MAYTTSELGTIIATLEACLAQGAAEVMFEGRKLVYKSTADIMKAIAYFKSLLASASDAPTIPVKKIRMLYPVTSKGFCL